MPFIPKTSAITITHEAPDSEELSPVDEIIHPEPPKIPDFAPYFDVNTPLPGVRNKAWKGYMLDVPEPVYRRQPALNASTIKSHTPCEWLYEMMFGSSINPEDAAIGTVCHWAALEPWRFDNWRDHMALCRTNGLSTKAAVEDRLNNPGKLVVTPEIIETAYATLNAVRSSPEAMALLNGCDPEDSRALKSEVAKEVTGIVWDEAFQIWKKWRVDLLPQKLLYMLDIKTTIVHPSQWRREAIKRGYIDQAVYYTHCHYKLTGEWRDWAWIVLTKKPPYMCRVVRMRNLTHDDPMYEGSLWKDARERLGLDESLQMGKIPKFVNAARETLQLLSRVQSLSATSTRQCWPAYEAESPIYEII